MNVTAQQTSGQASAAFGGSGGGDGGGQPPDRPVQNTGRGHYLLNPVEFNKAFLRRLGKDRYGQTPLACKWWLGKCLRCGKKAHGDQCTIACVWCQQQAHPGQPCDRVSQAAVVWHYILGVRSGAIVPMDLRARKQRDQQYRVSKSTSSTSSSSLSVIDRSLALPPDDPRLQRGTVAPPAPRGQGGGKGKGTGKGSGGGAIQHQALPLRPHPGAPLPQPPPSPGQLEHPPFTLEQEFMWNTMTRQTQEQLLMLINMPGVSVATAFAMAATMMAKVLEESGMDQG